MAIRDTICGVILDAGAGLRLRPLSFQQPKPMLPICNKSIIHHQIEFMKAAGISRFFIVVGHMGRHIMDEFGDGSQAGVRIHYVIQEKPLGIAHAVYQLEEEVNGPFLLTLGDIFFVPKDLGSMIRVFHEKEATAVLAVMQEMRPELVKRNFTVDLDASGFVTKVIEKPRYVKTNLKGCGIYLFDQPIFDAIRRTPRTAMRDEYEITTSIQILIDDGLAVYPSESVEWDMNVTVPCDLLECNLNFLKYRNQDVVIGDNVQYPDGMEFRNTVVGADVVFRHPIKITNSLVTGGAFVESKRALDRVIITPGNLIIQCTDESQERD